MTKSPWLYRSALGAMAALCLAPSAMAQTTTVVEPPMTYVVRAGDTLIDLARKYMTRPQDHRALQRENRVANPRRMATGRTLDIPVDLLRTRPDTATLESYRGQVEVLRNGQSQTLSRGLILQEGDLISTGGNAFARINLSDGSHAVVPSNSRIQLERLRRFEINNEPDHRLTVQAGRLENSVNPRQRPGTYRVTSPAAVSAVRGTQFRVAYDEASGLGSTGVLEGQVAIAASAGGDAALAGAGEGTVVDRNTPGVRVTPLPATPTLIAPETIQTGTNVVFKATLPAGASTLRGRIGNDTGITDPVAEAEARGDTLTFENIDEGRWFIRLTAVTAEGLEGRPRTYDFIRARNGLEGLALAQGTEGDVRTYRFGWRAVGEGEARFRFQLWRVDAEGEQSGPYLVDQPDLSDPHYTLTDLPPGDYAWRVEGVRHRFGQRLSVWSEPELLTLSR